MLINNNKKKKKLFISFVLFFIAVGTKMTISLLSAITVHFYIQNNINIFHLIDTKFITR